jgi:hypothetical protein
LRRTPFPLLARKATFAVIAASTRAMGVLDFGASCPSHFTPITYTIQRGNTMLVTTVHPRALL